MTVRRVEITSPGHDEDGARLFDVVLHDTGGARSCAWTGPDYGAAILAAEAWDADGVEVVDTVAADVERTPAPRPRVPAAWEVVEAYGVVGRLHVEVWRRIGRDRAIVALSPVSSVSGFVAAAAGDEDTIPLLKFMAPAIVIALRTSDGLKA